MICGTQDGCGAGCGGAYNGSVLTYTGAGGDYVQQTTYKYVGQGAGNFSTVPIVTPGNWCWLWIPVAILALLALLLLLPSKSQPPVVLGPPGICKIFGDPHLITFDQKHVSFYSQGEYWIVKSQTVHIQGRYFPTPVTHGLSATKEIVVGGPFLNGHKFRISALTATWDGQPILQGFPSQWSNPDPPVQATYDSNGKQLQRGRDGKQFHIVHVTFPMNVALQINRWNEPGEGDYINIEITMPAQPGQDGHCGNFNGNPQDDDRLSIRARVGTTGVPQGELLFNTKHPVVQANRPDLNNCPGPTAERMKDMCQRKGAPDLHACMIDGCFGGKEFAREGAVGM